METPATAYEVVEEYMRRLYDGGIVHGDLSEYTLVVQDGELFVIDCGQAVTTDHPRADDLLERDCRTITAFFQRLDVDCSSAGLRQLVTG